VNSGPAVNSESSRQGLAGVLERIILGAGYAASYLNLLLVLTIVIQVLCRYVLGRGYVVLEELQWHLYSVAFLIGISYVLTRDANVRMDLLFRRYKPKTREWVDVVGIIVLTLPFVAVIFCQSLDFVYMAWQFGERSEAPLGLPYRWAIKAAIPFSCILLAMAGVARVIRAFGVIFGGKAHGNC